MLLRWTFVTKLQQPFWAFLSFKTSPILYSCAEMSWFIPLTRTQPSASDATTAAWAAGWWGCLPYEAAPWIPSYFEGRSLSGSALLISTQLCNIPSIPAPHVPYSTSRCWADAGVQFCKQAIHPTAQGGVWDKNSLWERLPNTRDLTDQ